LSKLKINIVSYAIILPLLVFSASSCKSKKETSHTSKEINNSSKGLSEENQTKFTFYFIDGCKERMKGNIELAEQSFRECLKIDPSSAAVKYELGNIYRFNGLYDNALKYGKECANAEPKNEWYQLLYIECLHNKRQFTPAADVYARLIKNYPNRSEFYEGLAAEYMYSGSYEKSFKTFDELEKKFGENEAFTLNKIKLLKQLKKTAEVEIEFKKLIASNPSEIRYFTYLSEFYQETNQNEKAMNNYQEALKIDPKNPIVHLALADYYKGLNDNDNMFKEIKIAFESSDLEADTKVKILSSYYELSDVNQDYKKQADELCDIALRINATSSDIHFIKAEFLLKDKKIKEARDEYEQAIKLDKSSYSIWTQLLSTEAEIGEYQSLEVHSFEAMELFPNQPLPYFFNGLSNTTLKNYPKAIESFKDGLEFVYDNNLLLIDFYSSLGEVYNSNKEFEKSDKAFDDALKIDPDNASILNNYAYYLSLRKEKLERAEKFSRRSNELSPNNRSYLDTYGWILYQQGKYKEAESWLARAVKIGSRSAISEHYGDVLYKLDKKEEALKYWQDAKIAGGGSEFLEKKITEKKLYE
jgi:tetratricopeptide (TPR) repeat protein